jgi:membrane protein
MYLISKAARHVLHHPVAFVAQVVRDFAKNQGFLMAGAVAYYALLSLVPILILSMAALSHVVDQAELLTALGHYLEWLVPSQSKAVLADVSGFIDKRIAISVFLLVTMLFFSSLAFSILEKAMAVIFSHRTVVGARHFLTSALLPYSFVLLLSVALAAVTLVSVVLQSIAQESVEILGRELSLWGVSWTLLYLAGLGAEIAILTIFYLVLPVGHTRLEHAVLGAVTVTVIWEVIRHGLIWYFASLSKASVVYGSLTTAVVALFSMEIAASLLLLGAQVISAYEQLKIRLGA